MEATQMLKCVVIGDSGVGKSSILYRYSNNDFNQFNEPTLGAAFVSKVQTINGKNVKFQIWDTAGQQKYKSIAPIYYRQSQIAICVYDISNKKSFLVLNTWVKQIKENGPEDMMMVIVGNKCDLAQLQQVSYQEGKQYADSINALFKLTSAKQGKGIQDMFISIGQKFQERKGGVGKIQKLQRISNGTLSDNQINNNKSKCC